MELELDFLTWVDSSLSSVTQEFMDSVRKRNMNWFELNQHNPKRPLSVELSKLFSMSVCDQWGDKKNYKAADEHLSKAEEVLTCREQEMSPAHRRAFDHLVQTNRNLLQTHLSSAQAKEDRPRGCKVRIEDPQTQAMILAMQAMVIGIFGDTKEPVALTEQVINLDDGHAEHWKERFLALRRRRREDNHLDPPPDEEWKAMEKALELDGDQNSASILDGKSTLLHDCLKDSGNPYFGPNRLELAEVVEQLKSNARKAFEANPDCSNCGIRWAEVLCVSNMGKKWRIEPEARDEAKEQFELCLAKWKKCSHVLHKAGKFYFHVLQASEYGLHLYERSLQEDGTNYPCLMEWIRGAQVYRRYKKNKGTKILRIIDHYLPHHKQRKLFSAKLLCLKATLVAKKPGLQEAVEVWLEAIETYPDLWTSETEPRETKRNQIFGREVLQEFLTKPNFEALEKLVKEMKKTEEEPSRLERLDILLGAIGLELSGFPFLNSPPRRSPRKSESGDPNPSPPIPVPDSEKDENWRIKTAPSSGKH